MLRDTDQMTIRKCQHENFGSETDLGGIAYGDVHLLKDTTKGRCEVNGML